MLGYMISQVSSSPPVLAIAGDLRHAAQRGYCLNHIFHTNQEYD